MKKVFENEDFAVFDEFLSLDDFQLMWRYFQAEDFRFIHGSKWVKINRLIDGNPLFGTPYISNPIENDSTSKIYPVGNGIDIIFREIISQEKTIAPWVGERGQDWKVFFARPYLYPQGTGLAWHDDYTGVSGACIFYLHPEWNVSWGGELMIADSSTRNLSRPKFQMYGSDDPKVIGPYLDNAYENERLLDVGVGHFIQPKPNRFVVLKSGVQHMIKKIDSAAGDRCRCSIAGFFLNPEKVDTRN